MPDPILTVDDLAVAVARAAADAGGGLEVPGTFEDPSAQSSTFG